MRPKYYIEGIPFENFCVGVKLESEGFDHGLERKEVTTVNWAGQHGVQRDYGSIFFQPRTIRLRILATDRDKYSRFFAMFTVPRPVRITRELCNTQQHFDVYLSSPSRAATFVNGEIEEELTLSEDNPVKRVFLCAGGVARISISSEHALTVSWGDTQFESNVFDGNLEHFYTDNDIIHFVVISGRVAEAEIITSLQNVENVFS